MSCINCGGTMHGDGYSSVERCENLEEDADVECAAPDEGPFYCNYEDES